MSAPTRTGKVLAPPLALALALAGAAPTLAQDGTGDAGGSADTAAGATEASPPSDDPSSGGLRRVPEGVAAAASGTGSDYPTVALADYVLGCMAANGNSYLALEQCSCSIDYIRERMPFEDYEQANTVMQVQLDRGQRGIFYRDSNWAKARVDRLQALQAESTLLCF